MIPPDSKIKGPVFGYFGSKWKLSKHLPPPKHLTIVEPFAGSACYSLRYAHVVSQVRLYDLCPRVCMAWDFLLHATQNDILSLPLLQVGDDIDETAKRHKLGPEATELLRFIVSRGTSRQPRATAFVVKSWTPTVRSRLAATCSVIQGKMWSIQQADYREINVDEPATYFVDPPYRNMGIYYSKGSREIDYGHLGQWCKDLKGQVIVTEGDGHGEWLPFKPFKQMTGSSLGTRSNLEKRSQEWLWTNERDVHDQDFDLAN